MSKGDAVGGHPEQYPGQGHWVPGSPLQLRPGNAAMSAAIPAARAHLIIALCMGVLLTAFAATPEKKPCGEKLPLVYAPGYDISVLGIEYFHPFDTRKFGTIHRYLLKHAGLCNSQFHRPEPLSDSLLRTVHSSEYLVSLEHSATIAQVAEMPPLRILPPGVLRRGIVEPMRLAGGGTLLAAQLALQHGWAINLGGGYHHAKAGGGEGFCMFADIPVTVLSVLGADSSLRVLVVDLDAHQGNGVSSILGGNPRVAILDQYNADIYPADRDAERLVTYPVPMRSGTDDRSYRHLLDTWLPQALDEFTPGLVIYNAGSDIYEKDRLGGLAVTEEGIIDRDSTVFSACLSRHIPIAMVLSGGYHRDSARIVGRSVVRLLRQVAAIE